MISPAPVDTESWVAVLSVVARQLLSSGHQEAAAHVFAAVGELAEEADE